jgi:hypothetical protein
MAIYIDRFCGGGCMGAAPIGISGSEIVVVSRGSQHFKLPSGDGAQDTAVFIHLGGCPVLIVLGSDSSITAPPETATHQLTTGAYVAVPLTGAGYFAGQARSGGIAVLAVAVGTLAPQVTQEDAQAAYQADNPVGSRWFRETPPFDEPNPD